MRYLILAATIFVYGGCSRQEGPAVTSTFRPPSIDRLAEVESADCAYQEGVLEIEGVVSPASQGGWPRSADYDVHCFSFSAWRRPGQPVVRRELTILRPVDPEGDWFSAYPALSIHRIKVLLSKDETRAILADKSPHEADVNQLADIAEELAKPVVIKTERFGELTLDRSLDLFVGEVTWNGEAVEIHFEADENLDISSGLKVAERLLDEQASWKQKVEDFAVRKLLPLKNDGWLDEDENEAPLTPEQFKSRMTLQSISIRGDGEFEFWHDDGEMFWGHSIQISGSVDKGLTHADIPG